MTNGRDDAWTLLSGPILRIWCVTSNEIRYFVLHILPFDVNEWMFQLFNVIMLVIRVRPSDANSVPFIIRLHGKYRKNKPTYLLFFSRNFPFFTVNSCRGTAYPGLIRETPFKTIRRSRNTALLLVYFAEFRSVFGVPFSMVGRCCVKYFSLFVAVINFERPKHERGFRLKLKNIFIFNLINNFEHRIMLRRNNSRSI